MPLAPGCLRHEIGNCLGPCAAACTRDDYAGHVEAVLGFLEGRDSAPLEVLQRDMTAASAALLFGVVVGLPLGVWTATRRGGAADGLTRVFALLGFSLPDFYLGVLLLLAFSLHLDWFPMLGGGEAFLDALGTPYTVDPRLVRGLDYYTRTLFEIKGAPDKLGAGSTLLDMRRRQDAMQESMA